MTGSVERGDPTLRPKDAASLILVLSLDLPTVTRFMIGEIGARLESPERAIKPPFMRLTRRGYARDRIDP